jgi:hypothetical protein
MGIPKARVWWGVIRPELKAVPAIVVLLVLFGGLEYGILDGLRHGGRALLERHAEHRTAKVRAVDGNTLYMNDGTVWGVLDVPADPRQGEPLIPVNFLAGDAVRYESLPGGAWSKAGDPDVCGLQDETTGALARVGLRLTAPFAHSSCPSHTSTGSLFWGLFKRDSWW